MIRINGLNSNKQSGLSKKGVELMDNTKLIIENLKKVFIDAERAVPEYGDFYTVKYTFNNLDKELNVKDVTLSIKPSFRLKQKPKEREFEVLVNSANDKYSYSVVLKSGEKEDIMEFAKKEDLSSKINDFIIESSRRFSDLD